MTIPDDIQAAAREAANECLSVSGLGDEDKYAAVISRALMAERESTYSDCLNIISHAEEHYKGAVLVKIKREMHFKRAAIRGGTNDQA